MIEIYSVLPKLLIIFSILYSDVEILDVACGIGVMGEELRAAGYSQVSRAAGYSQVSRAAGYSQVSRAAGYNQVNRATGIQQG